MAREIFCKNCDFYIEDPDFKYPIDKNTGTDIHTVCICPYNIDEEYDPRDPHKFISCPSIINRNHDCNWFRVAQRLETYIWSHSKKTPKYKDHGPGTYNINPKGGPDGFYIGEKTLSQIIDEKTSQKQDLTEITDNIDNINKKLSGLTYKTEEHTKAINQLSDDVSNMNKKIDDSLLVPGSILYGGNSIY